MKKQLSPFLFVLALVVGCASQKRVVENTFYCSSPKLEIEVSQEFTYVGEKSDVRGQKEFTEGRDVTISRKYFVFQAPDKVFAVAMAKAPRDATWLAPDFTGVKNRIEYGKLELGGHKYHYCTYKKGPYIERTYLRNAKGATLQIMIVYREKALTMSSRDAQLKQFDKNCETAFKVK